MSNSTKIIYILISFAALFSLFYGWYKFTYSMEEAASFEVNSKENQTSLLIATQGSEFKNGLTNNIVNYYKEKTVFIKVIDISKLKNIDIKKFINNNSQIKAKTIVYTTSGAGTKKMKDVDALTGESKINDIDKASKQIIEKLTPILKTENIKI